MAAHSPARIRLAGVHSRTETSRRLVPRWKGRFALIVRESYETSSLIIRTDFAGSSTDLREGHPEYDATVGATVRFQRDYDGKQPGDPAKAAAALLHIASLSDPPLRLLLGSDSYNAAEQAALQKLDLDRKWKDLSISTDYASGDFSTR